MGTSETRHEPVSSDSAAVFIFSRMDSRRLPNKALRPIGDRPLLGWVIERVRRARIPRRIVVATSVRPIDDPIVVFAQTAGVDLFRGDVTDVAGRALACAQHFGCTRFVRISGDSPFIEPALIDKLLDVHADGQFEIATNLFPRSFPPGCSVEVVSTAALERALPRMLDAEDREHVTTYFYRRHEDFRIGNLDAGDDRYAGVVLTVDTESDAERCAWIARNLGADPLDADLDTIARVAKQWPAAGPNADTVTH